MQLHWPDGQLGFDNLFATCHCFGFMNTILEELQALEQRSQKMCPALKATRGLEPEAGEYVLKLLNDSSVSIRQIHLILTKKAGISVSRESLGDHRKGECGCNNDE